MNKNFYIKQEEVMDCGIASLANILFYYKKTYSLNYLKEIAKYNNKVGTSFFQLYNTAIKLGFKSTALVLKNIRMLNDIKLPCIAQIEITTSVMHFVVICEIKINTIMIIDPAKGFLEMTFQKFENCFTNKILLIYQKS